jgi:hypothetical protein
MSTDYVPPTVGELLSVARGDPSEQFDTHWLDLVCDSFIWFLGPLANDKAAVTGFAMGLEVGMTIVAQRQSVKVEKVSEGTEKC